MHWLLLKKDYIVTISFTFSDILKLKQTYNINKTILKNNNIINTYVISL
jgi:hypothetical protein